MIKSVAQVLGASAVAVLIACGISTINLLAQGVCSPLSRFEPPEGDIGTRSRRQRNQYAAGTRVRPCSLVARIRSIPIRRVRNSRLCSGTMSQQPLPVLMPPSSGRCSIRSRWPWTANIMSATNRITGFRFTFDGIKSSSRIVGDGVMAPARPIRGLAQAATASAAATACFRPMASRLTPRG